VDQTTLEALDNDVRMFPTGMVANAILGPKHAVGGLIDVSFGQAERLVEEDFVRGFQLPVENQATGSNLATLIETDLSSQSLAVHYARRIGERLVVGFQGGRVGESEKRSTLALYRIDHDVTTWSFKSSLAARLPSSLGPLGNWVVGANWRSAETDIKGTSADDLHQDIYDWDRPRIGVDVHLLGDVGEYVKGGLDFRYDSFEGQEVASYNWSGQFQLNPINDTVRLARSTFEEGFRSGEFETRWEVRPPGGTRVWGLGFEARQVEYWVLPETNVNSFQDFTNDRLTEWRGTVGMSHYLPRGKGLIAGEVAYGWADRDDLTGRFARTDKEATVELGVGAEYAFVMPLAARAGYRLILEDGDRDRNDDESESVVHRAAIGAGWRTPDGRILLDLGFSYDFIDPEAKEILQDGNRQTLTLQVRSLF
jgi:hypothetical protein